MDNPEGLTADELSHFSALENSGRAAQLSAQLAAHDDVAAAPVFAAHELRDAIDELERSTAAMARQSETLRQQQDVLHRMVAARRRDCDARLVLADKQAQACQAERKSLSTSVETMAQSIGARVVDMEQQQAGSASRLHQTTESILQLDDKLLSSLQKLGCELDVEDAEEQQDLAKLRDVSARLIKYTVEAIRTKLDRVYMESLEASIRSGVVGSAPAEELSALEEELESLYAEILPVAQMSAEQQFLEPALTAVDARDGSSMARSERALEYVRGCLDHLVDRMAQFSARASQFRAHQTAASLLAGTARLELAAKVDGPSPLRRGKHAGTTVWTAAAASSSSPVRRRANSGARRPSLRGGDDDDDDDSPLDELLRSLGLILPQPADPDAPASSALKLQQDFLASTLAHRRAKADDVARNVHESLEGAAMTQLADARRATQLLLDSVLAESPFAEVNLADPEIEASITFLAQECEEVQTRLRHVDAAAAKAKGHSVKRDALVKRWGPPPSSQFG
ncbi:hypothetical protein P8C59_000502 [Phyllachora maydis]|uniref:Uncharacterized protein n=1 Tax=Phyllachora maydis TaxID=1825666 RepID=A0AAD9HWG9_9PEZI|nr:hypothetical protein P8C59_000502 [Phyllachora maydis]